MELGVKKRYKQTEVGLIPEDWRVVNIGSQCQIFGRIGFRGYTVNDIVKEDQGAITLSPSNIKDGQLNLKKLTYLSYFKYEESPEIKIYNGDILLVKTGSTYGKTALVKNLKEKATLNPQVVVLKKAKCNNIFLGYLMNFPIVKNQIESSVVGGAIPTLSQKQISSFKIPLPPTLEEQKAIATALSDVDDLISNLDALIAKKKAIKQGAMQQLLTPPSKGGKRLEGFSGEWVEKTLGDVGEVLMCKRIFSYQTSKRGDVPFFKIGTFGKEPDAFITKELYQEFRKKFSFPKKGALLISASGTIGRTVEYCGMDAYYQDSNIIWIENNEQLLTNRYLRYILKIVKYNTEGSTIKRLYNSIIKKTKFFLPPSMEEQKAIAQILSDMDKELEELTIKKEKYQHIKQGMMQELLTGKTRLV